MRKPKAVIFDLDGVITDTAHYHFLAWKALADELGIAIDIQFNEQLKGVSREESLARILRLGDVEDKYTIEEKTAMATKKNDHYKSLILTMKPDEVLDGIPELLEALRHKDIKIGLASASKNAMTVLTQLNMVNQFDYIADAAKVKHSKPAPDIFIACSEYFGVEAKECIGVEDAQAGIEAIHSAAMFAVGVGDWEMLKASDVYFENTKDMTFDMIMKAYNN